MRALVLCEVSGTWSAALNARGHCVIQCDTALEPGQREVAQGWVQVGCDARDFSGERFDIVAAFPPCTDLAWSGVWVMAKKDVYPGLALAIACASMAQNAAYGLVENPLGLLARVLGSPTVICDPWQWADDARENLNKRTCLWLNRWPYAVQQVERE